MRDSLLSPFSFNASPPSQLLLTELRWQRLTAELCTVTSAENCGLHCCLHPLLPEDEKKVSTQRAASAAPPAAAAAPRG